MTKKTTGLVFLAEESRNLTLSDEQVAFFEKVLSLLRLGVSYPHSRVGAQSLKYTVNYLEAFTTLRDIRTALEASPRRAVEGDDGVEAYLSVSKSWIHKKIKELGFSADDVRSKTLSALLDESPLILGIKQDIEELHHRNISEITALQASPPASFVRHELTRKAVATARTRRH